MNQEAKRCPEGLCECGDEFTDGWVEARFVGDQDLSTRKVQRCGELVSSSFQVLNGGAQNLDGNTGVELSLAVSVECDGGHAVQVHDVGKITQPANVALHLTSVEGAISDDADPDRQEVFEGAVLGGDAACRNDGRSTSGVGEPETGPQLIPTQPGQPQPSSELGCEGALARSRRP